MILAPPLAFLDQYQIIKASKSIGNFSTLTCAILIISNLLRIFYWQAIGFALPLLLQSVLMIVAQLLLLHLCIRVTKAPHKEFRIRDFWKWTMFEHYSNDRVI